MDDVAEEQVYDYRPKIVENYIVPEFKIPTSTAKGYQAKLRIKLGRIYGIVKYFQSIRSSKYCTDLAIPSTNKKLISICGTRRQVSYMIEAMKYIGIIELADESFQFKAYYAADNHSKRYYWYIENEKKFIDYCIDNNIEVESRDKVDIDTIVDICKELAIFDKRGVKFSSDLRLIKPENWSKTDLQYYLDLCLWENYPALRSYQDLSKEINKKYYSDNPKFEITYEPNYHWNNKDDGDKWVHKIGIRATNFYCNSKDLEKKECKKKKKKSAIRGKSKQEVLKENGLNLHYDVSSSVPRLTLSLHNGYWVTTEEIPDVYRLFFDSYEEKRINRCVSKLDSSVDIDTIVDICKM